MSGPRGFQKGNTLAANRTRELPWKRALIKALRARSKSDKLEALDVLANLFLDECAKSRDVSMFKELADRLDGKSAQAVTGADGNDLVLRVVHEMR